MFVTREQLKTITGADYYDGSVIHDRFAYKFLRKKVIPVGSIISFRAPMEVTDNLIDLEDSLENDFIYSEDAINFCWEIPLIGNSPYGAVCFQRLFNTQLGTALSQILDCDVEVDGDDLIVHKEHTQGGIAQQKGKCSVSITYTKQDAALGHTAINITAGKRAPAFAYSTGMSDEQIEQFVKFGVETFYNLSDDIFIASTKVF